MTKRPIKEIGEMVGYQSEPTFHQEGILQRRKDGKFEPNGQLRDTKPYFFCCIFWKFDKINKVIFV